MSKVNSQHLLLHKYKLPGYIRYRKTFSLGGLQKKELVITIEYYLFEKARAAQVQKLKLAPLKGHILPLLTLS